MRIPGMVECSVSTEKGAWLVEFPDGSSLLLQSDYDQAAFAVACGVLKAPKDWDGSPDKLNPAGWDNLRPWDIVFCPEEYYRQALGEVE